MMWRSAYRLELRCHLYRLMVAIAGCIPGVTQLPAAEIRFDPSGEVVIEGTIEAGDYDRFQRFVREKGGFQFFLASPGGNLLEAIKIGRLVRSLKSATRIPIRTSVYDKGKLHDPKTNYMCASSCFFIFVAGVRRWGDLVDHEALLDTLDDEPILGIHRPYLPASELKTLTGNQAIASANQLRTLVERYLKEMSVPAKYAEMMFSVPKEKVRWIESADFDADLRGYIPELKDWLDAKCDKLTDIEKAVWNGFKQKVGRTKLAPPERAIVDRLGNKMGEQSSCKGETFAKLHSEALEVFFRSLLDH